jgi:hypothetical protein
MKKKVRGLLRDLSRTTQEATTTHTRGIDNTVNHPSDDEPSSDSAFQFSTGLNNPSTRVFHSGI